MSFFSLIQKKGSKPIPPEATSVVRKEIVRSTSIERQITSPKALRSHSRSSPVQVGVLKVPNGRTRIPHNGTPSGKRKRGLQPPLLSDSDSQDSDSRTEARKKRPITGRSRQSSADIRRRCRTILSDHNHPVSHIVHAANIASVNKPSHYKAFFPQDLGQHVIQLQYPAASQPEEFGLVEPLQHDDFKPLDDIKETLEVLVEYYLPPLTAKTLSDDGHGLLRKLKRAREKKDGLLYTSLLRQWNETVNDLRDNGEIARVLDDFTRLDLRLIERILTQTYARTVSPKVATLRQYENGTDNVYGELLPKFVSDIFRVTELKTDHIFVDLGSGVGTVVLQAALEVGCESWGCEIMENACVLAESQLQEFQDRCRLWGFALGSVNLQRGDFLKNEFINKVLQRADVVLVNNQAFTPELNDRLTSHFLDLKDGCQVVSLKSFVPAGHKITSRNLNSPYNILDVTEKRYYSACVSWTDAPGAYYISRKDSSRPRAFLADLQA
ncbi:MAG: hypothetical protein Q9220_007738 [cf. Caloplaca sp. 1 TL-2023]